jgi:hypothetical protein
MFPVLFAGEIGFKFTGSFCKLGEQATSPIISAKYDDGEDDGGEAEHKVARDKIHSSLKINCWECLI